MLINVDGKKNIHSYIHINSSQSYCLNEAVGIGATYGKKQCEIFSKLYNTLIINYIEIAFYVALLQNAPWVGQVCFVVLHHTCFFFLEIQCW